MDKIICVGKNYLEHAKELGDAVPDSPVLFIKPPSASIQATEAPLKGQILDVQLPQGRGSVHHECEIVLRLNLNGIPDAVTLGLDLTLRDLQSELKKKGHPWEVAKVFRHSAVLGPWIELSQFPQYLEQKFEFLLNGVVKQVGCGKDMRYSPDACLEYARKCFPLCEGDLLFTGTPAGVGPVERGQTSSLLWGDHLEMSVRFS